jgi:hypothetical protein
MTQELSVVVISMSKLTHSPKHRRSTKFSAGTLTDLIYEWDLQSANLTLRQSRQH